MKERKHHIKELSWVELQERLKETKTVIIPTGAVEVYGPHLPMGSDGFAALAVSERLAQATGALIAPMTEIAESGALMSFPGTFTVPMDLYIRWLEVMMDNLVRLGFENYLFLTGHGSTVSAVSYVANCYQREKGIKWAQVDWWRFVRQHGGDIFDHKNGTMAHGHASEAGTSVLLAVRPDLVDMDRARCVTPPAWPYEYPDIGKFTPLNEKTDCATVGDAPAGTAEKGRAIIDKCVERILDYMDYKWSVKRL